MRFALMILLAATLSLTGRVLKAADGPTRPLKVVCFGDSITGHIPKQPYLDKYVKWTDVLQNMLEARLGNGHAVVLNRGYGGDATYENKPQSRPGGINRFKPEVIDEKADLAVVLIGGNDKKETPEQRALTRSNLVTIVKGLKESGIRVLLLQYFVLPNPKNPQKAWLHLPKNNDLIAEVAKELDVPTLELQPAMDAAVKLQPVEELANAVDGVHLNPGGELIVAKTVFAKLDTLGWVAAPAARKD